MSIVVNQNRPFQAWFYSVSHGILLFRSVKSELNTTRFDVVFKNVKLLNVPTNLSTLTIDISDSVQENIDQNAYQNSKCFRVVSGSFSGYILADDIFWLEDQGEFYDESELLKQMGKFQLPI